MTAATPDAATVQDLATLIRPLVDRTSPYARTAGEYLTDGASEDLPTYIREVIAACEGVLILDSRRADPQRCHELQVLTACNVGPGEQDSFGWLSAVLYTPGGMVVFG